MKLNWALILLALLVLPGTVLATEGGKTLRYGGGGQGPVVFDGKGHASRGYVCNDCHLSLFPTAKKALVRMSDHFTDVSCFKCHDNNVASRDCVTCHRKVQSSGLVYSDYIREKEGEPLPETDRDSFLSGKFGVTEQSRACLSCHASPDIEPRTERGKSLNIRLSHSGYSTGAHGALACATCHAGLEGEKSFLQIPHAVQRPTAVDCQTCHNVRLAPEIASFSKSAHVEKSGDKFLCVSCHDAHTVSKTKDKPNYSAMTLQYNARCLTCHGDNKAVSRAGVYPAKVMNHDFLPKWKMHSETVLCADCHSPAAAENRHLIQGKAEALRECSRCHTDTNSLILAKAEIRDGSRAALANKYIPGVRTSKTLDVLGGYALVLILVLVGLHGAARIFGKKSAPHPDAETGLVREYIYSGFVRLIHWINAACFIALIWTGVGIRFEGLPFVLDLGWAHTVHTVAGLILILNYALFLFSAVRTGDIRQYVPHGPDLFGRLAVQARYYLYGIFRGAAKPFVPDAKKRFNPLQQVTYFVVFLVGLPVLALSGILLFLPESVTSGIASRQCLASLHYCLAIAYGIFLIGHLYLATTGDTPGALVRGMLTGFHERKPMPDSDSTEGNDNGKQK